MTELAFAKQFLTALDSRPSKFPPDHVEDPKKFPGHGAYILPKMPRPLAKKQKLSPGQERSLTVSLKSLRNPPLDITLKSQTPNTSILNLKESIHEQTSIPITKLRILHKKKPVPDSKVLKDLAGDEESKVEFSVMVLGGAAAGNRGFEEIIPPVARGPSATEVLGTEEFWTDLKGFLSHRLRDGGQAEKVCGAFREAWEERHKGK